MINGSSIGFASLLLFYLFYFICSKFIHIKPHYNCRHLLKLSKGGMQITLKRSFECMEAMTIFSGLNRKRAHRVPGS